MEFKTLDTWLTNLDMVFKFIKGLKGYYSQKQLSK